MKKYFYIFFYIFLINGKPFPTKTKMICKSLYDIIFNICFFSVIVTNLFFALILFHLELTTVVVKTIPISDRNIDILIQEKRCSLDNVRNNLVQIKLK